ncbi:hypothetical protein CDL15_Pgr023114 [Punica granatum]|uniref:UFSP1/2/DUB catalytic domain-containing protein n=1 Tax=Punica granatum TaxID=22663 RepID=A0A218X5R0_PUNGR|nr:hypothetical protein CDL15_Pgr023114 [Punica granatum]
MDFTSCPFCDLMVLSSELERHANGHFEDEEVARDMEFARQIALAPASPPKTLVFEDDLKIEISSDLGPNKSVEKDTSSCNYEAKKIDDGDVISCLISLQMRGSFHKIQGGLLALLNNCLEFETGDSTCILCGHVDHFQSIVSEDVGWGCGWRNIQMLSSHLISERREAREVLFGGSGFVPDILSIQRWLEIAWERGFDRVGAEHFNHKIYGSRSWIGTTECAALFCSFGLRAKIMDFGPEELEPLFLSIPGSKLGLQDGRENIKEKRSLYQIYGPMDRYLNSRKSNGAEASPCMESSRHSSDETVCSTSCEKLSGNFVTTSKGQQVLVDWVWNYFSGETPIEFERRKVTLSNKSPLYFQHDGHSRMIIGIQVKHQGDGKRQCSLLVLDPGHRTDTLEKSLRRNSGWQRLIKRGVHTLKKPQYQLCYVDPGIATGEEFEQLKTIDSVYVKF